MNVKHYVEVIYLVGFQVLVPRERFLAKLTRIEHRLVIDVVFRLSSHEVVQLVIASVHPVANQVKISQHVVILDVQHLVLKVERV